MFRKKLVSIVGSLLFALCMLLISSIGAPSAFAATKTTHVTAAAATTTSCPPTLQQGSSGTWVKALQYHLNIIATVFLQSNTHLATDGQFGPLTKNLVEQFQTGYGGLQVDGVVGPQTWSALGLCNQGLAPASASLAGPIYACPPTLRNGSSGTWVTFLQYYLNSLSTWQAFPLNPLLATDGQFGPHTTAAVKALQTSWLLQVDGVVGPQTWAALGMC